MDVSQILITPDFSKINFSVFVSKPILYLLLALFFIVYAILASILFFHWRAYGMRSKSILIAETLFLFVSLILFVTAGVTLTYF